MAINSIVCPHCSATINYVVIEEDIQTVECMRCHQNTDVPFSSLPERILEAIGEQEKFDETFGSGPLPSEPSSENLTRSEQADAHFNDARNILNGFDACLGTDSNRREMFRNVLDAPEKEQKSTKAAWVQQISSTGIDTNAALKLVIKIIEDMKNDGISLSRDDTMNLILDNEEEIRQYAYTKIQTNRGRRIFDEIFDVALQETKRSIEEEKERRRKEEEERRAKNSWYRFSKNW